MPRLSRILTAAGLALCCAIAPARAVTYAVRNAVRLTRTGTAPAFASTWTVTVYENGAIATANSTGTTITVASGHGFTTGDKLMVGTTASTYRTVASTSATTVVVNSAVTATSGAFIVNLGADTGSGTPSYDGSTVSVYQYSDGSGAYTQSRVTLDSQGRYGYWVDNSLTVMELFRNSAGSPDSVQFVSVAGGGGSSATGNTTTSGCAVDGTVLRLDGTSGTALTCSNATLGDDGRLTLAQAATPVVGNANNIIKATSTDGSGSATQITYPTGGGTIIVPFFFEPKYRIANTAAAVQFEGVGVHASEISGAWTQVDGFTFKWQPSSTSFASGTKYMSSAAGGYIIGFNSDIALDGQIGITYPEIVGFHSSLADDAGAGTSTWHATDTIGFRAGHSTSAFWSSIALLTNFYGVEVEDQETNGAVVTNAWGGFFGHPVLLEDNSAGAGTYDRRGYIAWAADKHSWLQTSSDVSGDGTADASDGVNARFRWNNDSTRYEFDIAQTSRWYLSRSSTTSSATCATTDDSCRLAVSDTTLGTVYVEVDAQSATPTVHSNLAFKSDSSTLLLNGLQSVAMNEDSQSVTCAAGTFCLQDSDSSSTDEVTFWEGTAPGTLNMASLKLEGATNNAFETTVAVEDPLSDKTITLPSQADGRPPVVIFSQNANVSVTGTTADQTIVGTGVGSVTLPANFFNIIGRGLVYEFAGVFTTDGTPGTLTYKVLLGSTTLCTSAAQALPASVTGRGLTIRGRILDRTTGATGTVIGQSAMTGLAVAASGAGFFNDCAMTAASSAIDLTGTLAFNLAVTWSTTGDTVVFTEGTITSIW